MNKIDKNLHLIAHRFASKVNENNIKLTVPVIIPISKQFIGYLKIR